MPISVRCTDYTWIIILGGSPPNYVNWSIIQVAIDLQVATRGCNATCLAAIQLADALISMVMVGALHSYPSVHGTARLANDTMLHE